MKFISPFNFFLFLLYDNCIFNCYQLVLFLPEKVTPCTEVLLEYDA